MNTRDAWRKRLVIAFRDGVRYAADDPGGPHLSVPPYPPIPLGGLAPQMLAGLARLAGGGGTEEEIAEAVDQGAEPWAVAAFLFHLRRFETLRLLSFAVRSAGTRLCTLNPISGWFDFAAAPVDPGHAYVLSRFAYQRRDGAGMVLESPRSHGKLRLEDPRAAALLLALSRPGALGALVAAVPGLPFDEAEAMLGLLVSAGFALAVQDAGLTEEESTPRLAPWSFHDLLFHARSRLGRHAEPNGKTFPFRDRLAPLPAVRPAGDEEGREVIPLWRPDLDAIAAADPPFSRVLEGRRTLRAQGAEPISVETLSEFLYRSARMRSRTGPVPLAEIGYEVSNRPYPSGGACYDIELYLAVDRCRGLDSGLYHYDPERHALTRRSARTPEVESILVGATYATMSPAPPQIVICMASRFQRVAWSYEGISYAVTLKNAGVLYQTFYLVATAMGLACCGVGRGDSDNFARAAGTDYFAETTVGEFLIGSGPET
ncbi:MAG TPA: SagB family peptide dehydrogenase [Polyangiaceae bacterium]|jgi:SagB-type dehydrogenase family enzyme